MKTEIIMLLYVVLAVGSLTGTTIMVWINEGREAPAKPPTNGDKLTEKYANGCLSMEQFEAAVAIELEAGTLDKVPDPYRSPGTQLGDKPLVLNTGLTINERRYLDADGKEQIVRCTGDVVYENRASRSPAFGAHSYTNAEKVLAFKAELAARERAVTTPGNPGSPGNPHAPRNPSFGSQLGRPPKVPRHP